MLKIFGQFGNHFGEDFGSNSGLGTGIVRDKRCGLIEDGPIRRRRRRFRILRSLGEGNTGKGDMANSVI